MRHGRYKHATFQCNCCYVWRMKEPQAGSQDKRPPPPPEGGPEAHARQEKPSGIRLAEWQGPVFWMSCGALLAGLVAGAVFLAQRVGLERDLMAVATTLPQAAPEPQARPRERAEPPPMAAARPAPSALEGPSVQEPGTRQAVPAPRHGARRASIVDRHPSRHAAAKLPAPKKTAVPRKHLTETERYREVFKRCPAPGEPGAVECRRHICNGAEREGPACRPYRSKLR